MGVRIIAEQFLLKIFQPFKIYRLHWFSGQFTAGSLPINVLGIVLWSHQIWRPLSKSMDRCPFIFSEGWYSWACMKLETMLRTKLEKMNGNLQWRSSSMEFSNSIIDFPTQNFPTTCELSVGIVVQYWEILVKSFFRKSVVESRKKFKSILKYFFTLSCLCFSLNEVCSLAFGSVCVYSCLFHSKIEK